MPFSNYKDLVILYKEKITNFFIHAGYDEYKFLNLMQ